MNQLNVNLPELPYAVSEAMNRLRINIKFCGKNTRKILLTSCQPNEGKSTISSYLWKMLAEAGFPTVLVDVDLRKSVMKTRFQMDYDDDTTMGLNHYLSGMAEYEDVVYSTNIPNGYMVPPFGDDDADVISDLFEIGEQLRTVKSVRHARRRGAKSTSCISGG